MLRSSPAPWLLAVLLGVAGALFLLPEGAEVPQGVGASPAGGPEPVPAVGLEAPAAPAPQLGAPALARERMQALEDRWRGLASGPRTSAAVLARTPGWIPFLQTWLRLPTMRDDAQRLATIQEAFAVAAGPVVRQNLVFLAALVLPLETAAAWLGSLADGADPDDAQDALVALAFSGDAAAGASFRRLARDPAPVSLHLLLDGPAEHDALAARDDATTRGVLRSYRAIEAFLREPYFKMVAYTATYFRAGAEGFQGMLGWTDGAPTDTWAARDLLEAWLARHPGHPGSDDVALRIARIHLAHDDRLGAARWYSKASVLPDQDAARVAARALVGLCELDLTPEAVLALGDERGGATPNRRFLQYVWLRRVAAERGFADALAALHDLALAEPEGELAAAWHGRWRTPPPRGLTRGTQPLAADDPLLHQEGGPIAWPRSLRPYAPYSRSGIHVLRWGPDALRLDPWPEPVLLDRERLATQVRSWEALAELERRTRRAGGDARATLLYQQAAVFHHDRDVLYPAYGEHDTSTSSLFWSPDAGRGRSGDGAALRERFEATTLSHVRALALLGRIEREHADWSGLDRTIYSQGILWRRLVDYRPGWACLEEHDPVRETVAAFERLVRDCPQSTLAPSAAAAAAWWRRAHPSRLSR